jgi:hypothetical protein
MAVETEGVVTGKEQGPQKGGRVRCLGAIRTEREPSDNTMWRNTRHRRLELSAGIFPLRKPY